jgi:hypothetical protein
MPCNGGVASTRLKTAGPSNTPASISPTMDGCLYFAKSPPIRRADTIKRSRLVNNGTLRVYARAPFRQTKDLLRGDYVDRQRSAAEALNVAGQFPTMRRSGPAGTGTKRSAPFGCNLKARYC